MRRAALCFRRPGEMTRTNLERPALTYATRSNIAAEAHISVNIPNNLPSS